MFRWYNKFEKQVYNKTMPIDLTYSKLTRNQNKLTQYLSLYNIRSNQIKAKLCKAIKPKSKVYNVYHVNRILTVTTMFFSMTNIPRTLNPILSPCRRSRNKFICKNIHVDFKKIWQFIRSNVGPIVKTVAL